MPIFLADGEGVTSCVNNLQWPIFKIMSFSTLSKGVPVEWIFCKLTDTDIIDRFFQDVNEFDLL